MAIIITSFINDFKTDQPSVINEVLTIVEVVVLMGWLILTGHELYKILPPKVDLNFTLFMINSFLCIAAVSSAVIILGEGEYSGQGLVGLLVCYLMYAYFHLHAFTAKALRSIELRRKARFGDYVGEFFLLLFWPVGIWVLQPRINKIAIKKFGSIKQEEITIDEFLK
ncbi:hypothetical protein [Rufibacter sp. LB8]|uniref:hypothetical protein n=1 Tax=Rufibacter sp. LB8 TaxID=2777781 RepID=UPI00178C7BFD|nr:hypothetical protein [Rufibacter sp. LB8]